MLSLFTVLDPKGAIGLAERTLMYHAMGFMLIVAVIVYFLLFFFAWRYRAGNKKAKYLPNWEHGRLEELAWWVIPLEIVLVLGALTWTSTHELDPRKPIASSQSPLVVQVVALDWKWLFIYPTEGVASVNYLALPAGRPVEFRVTADAPMNSFYIPQLGSQIYAMTGMVNTLNLVADEPGTYAGLSANYSGGGFAQMRFNAQALAPQDFDAWVATISTTTATLDFAEYKQLAKPGTLRAPVYYADVAPGLYEQILGQFADPVEDAGASHGASMQHY